jgi:hypothetical protein
MKPMDEDLAAQPLLCARAVAAFLHGLWRLDPQAIAELMTHRVPCNRSLADHPTVQVGARGTGYMVGPLGILNGLLTSLGLPMVRAVVDDQSGEFVGFTVHPPNDGLSRDAQEPGESPSEVGSF